VSLNYHSVHIRSTAAGYCDFFTKSCSSLRLFQVTAIDIFPAELPDQPDNLECEIHNLNEPLHERYGDIRFDLIHSRCVAPGIRTDRWQGYINELARLLTRGGWLQCAELHYNIQSDSGRLTEEHSTYHWYQYYRGGMEQLNRDPRIGRKLKHMFQEARLVNIQDRFIRIPIGDWRRGEQCASLCLRYMI
jgi:hypothetical protein